MPALGLHVSEVPGEDSANALRDVGEGKRAGAENTANVGKLRGDVESDLVAERLAKREKFVRASGDVWRGQVDEMRGCPHQWRDHARLEPARERKPQAASALRRRHYGEDMREGLHSGRVGADAGGNPVSHGVNRLDP